MTEAERKREAWNERIRKAREGDVLEALALVRLCIRGMETEHVLMVAAEDLGLGQLLDEVIAKEVDRRDAALALQQDEEAKALETWADMEKEARKEPDGSEGYDEGLRARGVYLQTHDPS